MCLLLGGSAEAEAAAADEEGEEDEEEEAAKDQNPEGLQTACPCWSLREKPIQIF